jgi:hypothetical protein
MHTFNGFDDQSETYHDTWTNYLMEKETSLTQDQAMVVDTVVAEKIKVLEERKGGPSRAMLKSILLSVLHV